MGFSCPLMVGIPQMYWKLMDFSTHSSQGSNLSYLLKLKTEPDLLYTI